MMVRLSRKSPYARFKFSLKQFFLLVAIVCVGVFLGSICWHHVSLVEQQARLNDEANDARGNLKRIAIALQNYQDTHRTLPYSDNGPDSALFAIRQLIDAAAFESPTRSERKARARWDTQSRQLVNGDVAYLNEWNAALDGWRVILACDLDGSRQLYVTANGFVQGRCQPTRTSGLVAISASELLGSWVTVEGFLVADEPTFVKWCQTHPFGEQMEETSIGEGPNPIAARFKNGSRIQYVYAGGSLKGCKIAAANGRVIDEVVETDRYGRIVRISRSPEE